MHGSRTAWGSIECFALRHARHRFSVPRTAQQLMDRRSASPPSPSDPPRCDRPSRQISDFPPNSPDRALRFTAIRASERFRGRVALPALSGPLPRTAAPKARAPNPRHDAPRGPPGPRHPSTKRPASTSRRALNSPIEPASNGGRVACASPSHNPSLMRFSRSRSLSSTRSNSGGSVRYISRIAS
jgi:hypothetical protein